MDLSTKLRLNVDVTEKGVLVRIECGIRSAEFGIKVFCQLFIK
jgi:hypothetical protein